MNKTTNPNPVTPPESAAAYTTALVARLAVYYLRDLSERMGNAGCNDLPDGFLRPREAEEIARLVSSLFRDEDEDEDPVTVAQLQDWMVVDTIAHELENILRGRGLWTAE